MTANHLFSIGSEVGNHLWQSTIFALLIWLMTLALRRNRAGLRYALWMAASFKFLLPFSLLLSIGGLMQRQEQITVQGDQAAYSVTAAVMQPLGPQPDLVREDSVPESAQRLNRTAAAVVTIWLCGTLGFLSIWLRRGRRLRDVLKDTVPADKGREYDALRV
jgi:bla regulator protein BlaR1